MLIRRLLPWTSFHVRWRCNVLIRRIGGSCQWPASAVVENAGGGVSWCFDGWIPQISQPCLLFLISWIMKRRIKVLQRWNRCGQKMDIFYSGQHRSIWMKWIVPYSMWFTVSMLRESGHQWSFSYCSHHWITSISYPYENGKTKYRYVVTALDRLHNESKIVAKKVKL